MKIEIFQKIQINTRATCGTAHPLEAGELGQLVQ